MSQDQAPQTDKPTSVTALVSSSSSQNTVIMAQDTSTAATGDHMDARAGELSATTAMQDPTLAISDKGALSSPLPDALTISIPATDPTPEDPATEAEMYMSNNDLTDPGPPVPGAEGYEALSASMLSLDPRLPVSVQSSDGVIAVPSVISRTSEEHHIGMNIHLRPNGTVIGSYMACDLVKPAPSNLFLPGNDGYDFLLYGYNIAGAGSQDSFSSLDIHGRTSEYSDGSVKFSA